MTRAPDALPADLESTQKFLAARKRLRHLRVRRRADLLVIESGELTDPIAHARLRRLSAKLWGLECATHSGRWKKTGFCDTRNNLLALLVDTLPWLLAPFN